MEFEPDGLHGLGQQRSFEELTGRRRGFEAAAALILAAAAKTRLEDGR